MNKKSVWSTDFPDKNRPAHLYLLQCIQNKKDAREHTGDKG